MKFPRILINGILLLISCAAIQAQDRSSIMQDISYLASDELEGRETGTEGNELARTYLERRFETIGLKTLGDGYFQDFTFKRPISVKSREVKEFEGKNLIGIIPGSSDKYIIITAHYDHIGVIKTKIHNGADDNASGTAGLLAIASYFKNNTPQNNLVFVAFDAEEKGLQGAKYFVENLSIAKENILLNVNMDMISRSNKNEIYACGTYHYPQFKPLLEQVGGNSPVNLKFGHDSPELGYNDWTNSSDHGPFHAAQIPFIYFGVEDHEDYHKHTDETKKINPNFVEKTVTLITDFIASLDAQ